MRARAIDTYHRPDDLAEALRLVAAGAVPLAGGTRLLADGGDLAEVVDLTGLGLGMVTADGSDLRLGAAATLQDVIDSAAAYGPTAGLLPAACRARSASRMVRGMATVGGEAVFGAGDADVVAALLALNAVFVVNGRDGPTEVPATRFLREPSDDLGAGRLLTAIVIPGPPDGAAFERVAVLPSAPSLVSVATAVWFAGERCVRLRIALTGLQGRPARVPEAESAVEHTACDPPALARCLERLSTKAAFREDAHASASYRGEAARALVGRAVRRAVEGARGRTASPAPRLRPLPAARPLTPVRAFDSGDLELTVNGARRRAPARAETSLLDLLRAEGFWGVKHGCETGECGACTVLLDGRPVCACITLAARAHGRAIETVEGLGDPDRLHPIQAAFVETGAIQCGFCTPAMELAAKALLDAVPSPSEEDARDALAGCLCRCTGYVKPVEAVLRAAAANRR